MRQIHLLLRGKLELNEYEAEMTEEFKNKILKEKEEDRIKADAIKKRENGIAVARLISFLAAFVLTYLGLVNGNYFLPAGIVLFVAFFISIPNFNYSCCSLISKTFIISSK